MPIKNFDLALKTRSGEAMRDEDGKPALMKNIIVNALDMNPPMGLKPLTGEQKHIRATLAQRVFEGGDIELKDKESVMIKEAVEMHHPLIVGQIYDYLDA